MRRNISSEDLREQARIYADEMVEWLQGENRPHRAEPFVPPERLRHSFQTYYMQYVGRLIPVKF
jgi:hypothetical protein